MALALRWTARRWIAAAVAAVITTGFVTLFAVIPRAHADETRLGCGTYCQAAGPLQGGIGEGREAVSIQSSQTVTLDADGYLPVTLTCNLSVPCTGYLSAGIAGLDFIARSDLLVNKGATATLGVALPAQAVAHLRRGPDTVGVLANVGPSFGCQIASHIGLPPCHWPINGFTPLSDAHLRVVAR